MALDVGAIDTSFTVYSPGVTQIDGITIRDWKFLGTVDLTKALQQSSNIYMATVAKKTGYDRLIAGLKRYGMDDPVLHFLAKLSPFCLKIHKPVYSTRVLARE